MYYFLSTAIELQFDRTVYTVHEAEGLDDEIISITKGGVVSEQVLDAVVQVVDLTPNSAELGKETKSSAFYNVSACMKCSIKFYSL